jgi:hypothetical protein
MAVPPWRDAIGVARLDAWKRQYIDSKIDSSNGTQTTGLQSVEREAGWGRDTRTLRVLEITAEKWPETR